MSGKTHFRSMCPDSPRLPAAARADLTVVVPTLNERDNVRPLVAALEVALDGLSWEVLFVDDNSTDGTLEVLADFAAESSRVHFIRRIGRRGLSSAVVEGMLASTTPYVAVMDADLQHDESVIRGMYEAVRAGTVDVASASRFLEPSHLEGLSERREQLSRLGIWLCRLIVKADLTDPLTGCFVVSRTVINEVVERLSLRGFKILLDIFASSRRPLAYREFPMHFRRRYSGESKLDTLVSIEFLTVVADKLVGRWIPIRFVAFVLVGSFGVLVHLAVLATAFRWLALDFAVSQALGTYTAMTVNYFVNNQFTYRDMRLRGFAMLGGLLSFVAICTVGAVANVQVAKVLFEHGVTWLLAGLLGAVVGSVWNYGVSSTLTWRVRNKS